MRCIQPVGGHQLGRSAALAELIPTVDELDGSGLAAGNDGCDGLGKASECIVLLGNHHGTGLADRLQDSGCIQGLHGRHVQHLGADSLCLEGLCGLQGLPYQMAGGNQGHVLTRIQIVDLAYLEGLVRIGEIGHGRAAETKIDGAHHTRCGQSGLHGLVVVAGHKHGHAGQGAHQGQVFHGLVRGAIFTKGYSRVGRSELDVGVAVGYFLTHLVVHAAGHELGEGAAERHFAGKGEAGCDAYHVGFRDAALNESFGEFLGKGIHLQGAFKVCSEGNHIGVLAACEHEACTESAAGIFLSGICILLHTSNLLRFL